jgi:23S rRNA (guanosine2251-2'-O)-methyltransferase
MNNNFIIGVNAVIERLKNHDAPVYRLYLDPRKKGKRIDDILNRARSRGVEIIRDAAPAQLNDQKHQGVVLEVPAILTGSIEDVLATRSSPSTVLILDSITDPHNMGACIRTAAATGADAVIVPKYSSAGITPVVTKASAGALEHISLIEVPNLVRTAELLKEKGYWIVGTSADSEMLYDDLDSTLDLAVIIGSEGRGMRKKVAEACDFNVRIPLAGGVESLNASVATAIVLFDIIRKRGRSGGS